MNDAKVNEKFGYETLQMFHERILGEYAIEKITPAVLYLRSKMAPEDVETLREMIRRDPWNWCVEHHFNMGMHTRNLLRHGGFGEDYWPIWNLDDIYVPLLERAVGL